VIRERRRNDTSAEAWRCLSDGSLMANRKRNFFERPRQRREEEKGLAKFFGEGEGVRGHEMKREGARMQKVFSLKVVIFLFCRLHAFPETASSPYLVETQ